MVFPAKQGALEPTRGSPKSRSREGEPLSTRRLSDAPRISILAPPVGASEPPVEAGRSETFPRIVRYPDIGYDRDEPARQTGREREPAHGRTYLKPPSVRPGPTFGFPAKRTGRVRYGDQDRRARDGPTRVRKLWTRHGRIGLGGDRRIATGRPRESERPSRPPSLSDQSRRRPLGKLDLGSRVSHGANARFPARSRRPGSPKPGAPGVGHGGVRPRRLTPR